MILHFREHLTTSSISRLKFVSKYFFNYIIYSKIEIKPLNKWINEKKVSVKKVSKKLKLKREGIRVVWWV